MTIDAAKSYDGTCQACFRRHSTRQPFAYLQMVHHGYERPGTGWIVGDCIGVGHEPYELSCEQTKVWRQTVADRLAFVTKEHLALAADAVDVLHVTLQQTTQRREEPKADAYGEWYRTNHKKWGVVGWHRRHVLAIGRDHVPAKERGERVADTWTGPASYGPGHNFAHYRAQQLARQVEAIAELTRELEHLDRRVKEWVYAPEKLTAYEGAKRAGVVHLESARPGRAACQGLRRTARLTTTTPAEVTCTRCRARLPKAAP